MTNTAEANSCVVVRAGVSGLLAARELSATGGRVVVLDEGRDIGGQMATQRMGNGTFDHGAQFFTVRSERFERPVAGGWKQASSRSGPAASPTRRAGTTTTAIPATRARRA